jgi:hypothetical protein
LPCGSIRVSCSAPVGDCFGMSIAPGLPGSRTSTALSFSKLLHIARQGNEGNR